MIKHFIFTRFNLLDAKTDIYNNPRIQDPDAWMEHRLKIFEQYTLPSMLNQTNKNFTWLLAFSEKTPMEVLNRYDYALDGLRIIFTYPKDWIRCLTPETDWLITSRLDNDDYYDPGFIDRIQSNADEVNEIIDIDYQQLDHVTGKRYSSLRASPNSPFLSLVEPWGDDIKTCFHCSHTNMIRAFPAWKINHPLATMVIHEKNQLNRIIGDEIL